MRASLVVAVVAWVGFAPNAFAADPQGVLLLHHPGSAAREALLFDALRIYTRDLGRPVTMGSDAPAGVTTADLNRVAAEARLDNADLALWFGGDKDRPILYALRVEPMDLRVTDVDRAHFDSAARTLALKIRALLTKGVSLDDEEWMAVPAPDAPRPTPPPLPVAVTPIPPPQPLLASQPSHDPLVILIATPRPTPRTLVEMSVGYGPAVASTTTWLSQDAVLRVAVPLPRLPLVAFADAAFGIGTRPSATVGGETLSIGDYPIGIGVGARIRRGRITLTGGPRISLHIIDYSDLTADGRTASRTLVSPALGLLAEGAFMLSDHIGVVVAATGDLLLQDQQFEIARTPVTNLGEFQFGASAGILFTAP